MAPPSRETVANGVPNDVRPTKPSEASGVSLVQRTKESSVDFVGSRNKKRLVTDRVYAGIYTIQIHAFRYTYIYIFIL